MDLFLRPADAALAAEFLLISNLISRAVLFGGCEAPDEILEEIFRNCLTSLWHLIY